MTVYGILFRPVGWVARSGLWPVVEAAGMVPVEFGRRWQRWQLEKSWTAGTWLRRWGNRWYGSGWNSLTPFWDERAIRSALPDGEPHVRILRRKENSGVCGVARNNGSRLAKGEILMFLDADDVWQPDKMAKQVTFMDEHPEFLFCHTACWVVDGAGKILHVRHEGCLPDSGDCVEVLLDRMWVSVSTIAVRSLLWNALGGFTENPAWGGEEDLEFSLRCARKTQFGTIKEPLAKYRMSGENWTSKKWQGVGRDYVAYRRIYDRRELWSGVKTESQMRALLTEMAVEGCQYWRARSDWTKARWFACQSLRWRAFSSKTWRQVVGAVLKRR